MSIKYLFAAVCLSLTVISNGREYHVAESGSDFSDGSSQSPLRTVNAAARLALPGDTITVHSGTYREWVDPMCGGKSDRQRILYRAAEGETVHIKGSEQVKGWKKDKKGIWTASVDNSIFGSFNPFAEQLQGDWFNPMGHVHHLADVYLDGVSLYEVDSLSKVYSKEPIVSVRDPQGSTAVWYAEVKEDVTVIYANFGEANPEKAMVEISVRPNCFYPSREGLNYITVRGFNFSQAATRWAPPTAEQVGMVSTHWSKGWIIEDNVISNSRSAGITLGKEAASGQNVWTKEGRIDGSLHYLEVIFRTLRKGWNRDNIGSHIIRNNEISDCEQAAICGSMGCAFSEVYGNHIHDIWTKRQFDGPEIGGVKFHGGVDVYIHDNCVHNCGRGIWLDWMGQGARISSNLLFDNTWYDLYFEVTHGPYMVDNNILLSPQAMRDWSEGGAFVHNLFNGYIIFQSQGRFVPYQLEHSTDIKGISTVHCSDNRFYNNVFASYENGKVHGLAVYDKAEVPIVSEGNVVVANPDIKLTQENGAFYLECHLPPFDSPSCRQITTSILGTTKLTDYHYENPDGSEIVIDKDYFKAERSSLTPVAGPFESAITGSRKVW